MNDVSFAKKNITYSVVSLIFLLILSLYSNFDLRVQDNFFFDGNWLISKEDFVYRYIFYKLPKFLIGVLAVSSIVLFLLSFRFETLKKIRHKFFILFFSIILVASTISGLKRFTNIYCPKELLIYGGDKPYKKIYNPEKWNDKKKGSCFPAGHASGGFSLMSLFYVIRNHRFRAVLFGIILGILMGGYQMMTGAHFLSDTLTTMIIAWIIINVIYLIYNSEKMSLLQVSKS